MKKNSFILTLLIGITIFLISIKEVQAATYDFNLIPYNVSTACDLDNEGGDACFEKYLDGDLESYAINNSIVSGGQTIMVIVQLVPSSDSQIASINYTIKPDISKLKVYAMTYEGIDYEIYSELSTDLGYKYNIYPEKFTPPNKRTKTWTAQGITFNADGSITGLVDSGNDKQPLKNTAPLAALFFKVNANVTPGSSMKIEFLTNEEDLNGSGPNGEPIYSEIQPHDLTLNVLSNVSTNGTLSELTATGSNALNYPFGFIPSDPHALEYSFIVPNAVTSVTFDGTATDEHAKGITGLDTPHSLNVGDNSITIAVTAESGDVTTYKIKVRRLSDDATLNTVAATNDITFDLPSNQSGTSVTVPSVTVPYKTSSTTITATPSHLAPEDAETPYATIESGDGDWTIATDNNTNKSNNYSIVVKAENCQYTSTQVPGNVCTKKTYNFTIIRTAPSKNFDLASLTIDGTSVPDFSANKTTYTLSNAPASKGNINIEATLADTKNSFTSDSDLGIQTVQTGPNTYTITVQGEDGLAASRKTYTINIRRVSDDKTLSSLNITSSPQGTLSPAFGDSVSREYTYTYAPNVTSIRFSAIASDTGKAYVSIIDMSSSEELDDSDKVINTNTKSFGVSVTKVGVIVTAEDGSKQAYKVNLVRQKSTNNYLSGLSISPGSIKETFKRDKYDYTAEVDPDVTSVTVTPTLEDHIYAKVEPITGNNDLQFGPNTITVTVKSETGDSKPYYIVVTRKKYNIATLSGITYKFDSGSVTNVSPFSENTLTYNLSTAENPISYDTQKITIGYTKGEEHEKVTGDIGEITLSNFSKRTIEQVTKDGKTKNVFKYVFTINVESHDEAKNNPYELTLYQDCNPDNSTTGVTVRGVAATQDASDPNVYHVTLANTYTTVAPSNVVVSTNAPAENIQKQTETINLSTTGTNIFRYTITSESGDVASYEIHIVREPSKDANITRIDLTTDEEETAYCVMNANESACTINVDADTTGYTLHATINEAATISPSNDSHYDMPLDGASSQPIVFTVTPESGESDKKEYTITIKRSLSVNAKLSSITITDADGKNYGIDKEDFNEDKTSYSIKLPHNVGTVYVSAELSDTRAEIKETLPIEATVGFDEVVSTPINVTAEDTKVKKTYYINFTREKNTDASLQDIQIDGNTVQGFNPDTPNFSHPIVDYSTTTIDITAITADSNAKVTSMKVTYANGNSKVYTFAHSNDVTQTIDLATGENVIEITTAPQAGGTGKTYTVTLSRQKNNNTDIDGITIAGVKATVDPTNKYIYNATVLNNITIANQSNVDVAVKAGATENDAKAEYAVIETPLRTIDSEGRVVINQVLINVTPEEGDVQTYILNVIRTASDVATLTRINLYIDGKAAIYRYCQFSSDYSDNSCTLNVPSTVSSIRLEGITTDANATVSFRDLAFKEGPTFDWEASQQSKIIAVTVTAEDLNTTRPYSVTINRDASDEKGVGDITAVGDNGKEYLVNGFGPTTYQITVDGDVNELTLDVTPADANASVVYKGGTSGDSPTYAIGNGKTTLTFDIKSEAGATQPYTIEVSRLAKTDNTLSYLNYTLSDGNAGMISLEEGTFDYTIPDVPYSVSTIEIGATANDAPDATVSGDVGSQVIKTGSNTYTITVTAQDKSEQDYTITVVRAKNTDATLKILALSGYTLSPVTTSSNLKNTFEYHVTVGETTTSIPASSINAVATDEANAKVTKTSGDLVLTDSGEYRYTITVQPEDKNAPSQEYVIVITKPESTDTRLSSITLTGATIVPEFDKDKRDGYTITVPYDGETFTIDGVPNVATSSIVSGKGTYNVSDTEEVIIEVESESGSTGTYKFNIVQAASTDSSLATLSVSGYRFTENFVSSKLNYSIGNIVVTTDTIVVNANPTNANAKWKYYYGTDHIASCENKNSCEINLDNVVGEKTISVTVQAADGVSSHSTTYTIKYNKVQSSNNNLASLEVAKTSDDSELELDKEFDKNIDGYDVNVANDVTSVTLKLTTEDSNASISVNGSTPRLHNLTYVYDALEEGTNTATIIVTSANNTTNTYYVYINRAQLVASSDATLSSLHIYNGITEEEFTLTPTFAPNKTEYDIGLIPFSLEVIRADVKVNMSGATIAYYVDEVRKTQTTGILSIPKIDGEKEIKIVVLAEDKTTEKEYTIKYRKEAEDKAKLTDIIIDGYDLHPTFSPDTPSYTLDLPEDVDNVDITAIPEGEYATITINGEEIEKGEPFTISDLPEGTTTVNITVTAEDGTVENYTIEINRGNDALNVITSEEYGHTITDEFVMTAVLDTTVDVFKTQFDNPTEELFLYNADGETLVTSGRIATGMVLKLERNGEVLDSKLVVVKGDTSGDGVITMIDASKVMSHYLETEMLSGAYLAAADTSGDDVISMIDASKVMSHYLETELLY